MLLNEDFVCARKYINECLSLYTAYKFLSSMKNVLFAFFGLYRRLKMYFNNNNEARAKATVVAAHMKMGRKKNR